MRKIISKETYDALKAGLNAEDKKIIEGLERDCEDSEIDYWEFYRRVEAYRVGQFFTPEKFRELVASPMFKMRTYLMRRAGELRGMKFSE